MKRCSENMQQIYGCSPVNLLHIFRTSFLQNISKGLLLTIMSQESKIGLKLKTVEKYAEKCSNLAFV